VSQILVIDVGNSRMKWAMRGPGGWTARGAVANQDIGSLAVRDWQNVERPVRAVGVNVAGEAARVRVEGQLARWRLPIEWLAATAESGGVVNSYANPAQLGPDRWASLIAARLVRRGKPLDGEPPAGELAFDADARRFTGDVDADGARRALEVLPVANRKRADVLVGDGAAGGPAGRAAHRPLHPAVTDVDDEDLGHGRVNERIRKRVAGRASVSRKS
jgi:type III pantothenate kinase